MRIPLLRRGPSRAGSCYLALVLSIAGAAGGCSQQLKPIFEPQQTPIVWPSAPARARIHYVGQLGSSADLKPPRKPFQAIGDFLVGAKGPQRLYGPRAVVSTGNGERLWIADAGGRCLHLFDLKRRTYEKIERAGSSVLLGPVGICRGPTGSIFVCDAEDVAIHRFHERTGELIQSLKLTEDIRRPVAVSYDAETEELFVVDVGSHDIKVLSVGGRLRRVVGRRGTGPGEFNYPCDIVSDGQVIWVVDTGNHRVQGLTRSGEPFVAFGQAGDAPGDLALPKSVAVDSEGHVYVVDSRFENVQVFDRSGNLLMFFGEEGTGPGEFWLPAGIFIDERDRIWVCDQYNARVQVFDYVDSTLAEESGGPRSAGTP